MFLRIVSDSCTRKPRRKVLTAAALALGMAVATATLEVALDVGESIGNFFRGQTCGLHRVDVVAVCCQCGCTDPLRRLNGLRKK